MGRVVFRNPNEPEQPRQGVYRWFCEGRDQPETTFYVGQAGGRRPSLVRRAGTLARGVSELQRGGLSSDNRHTLDTDFVVGTMIMYLVEHGFDCIWEHISDKPADEPDICRRYNPKLQGCTTRILRCFKLARADGSLWDGANSLHVNDAKDRLYNLFEKVVGA
jgi:hypothetical protein